MKKLTIDIDFDGTLFTDRYPYVGEPMTGAVSTVNRWYEQGHFIIVNTCRTGEPLERARYALEINGFKYHLLNENNPELIAKYGGDCRKISQDVAFDDRNAGGFMGWDKADDIVERMANHKPVIICIIGESGSGKTTLAEYLDRTFNLPMIESRTTRKPRYKDETGHTFVTDEEFDSYQLKDMLAFAEFGGHRYCCLKTDVKDYNTYVIEELGYKYLCETFGDYYTIYSIRLVCPEEERIHRVGAERVERDKGKFNMALCDFDCCINTAELTSYDGLHGFINECLNRGWN